MNKITIILLFVLAISTDAIAQNNTRSEQTRRNCPETHMRTGSHNRPRINKEQFRQRVQELIVKEAGLSQKEAEAFFPIFHEYKDRQRQIHVSIDRIKNAATEEDNENLCQERVMKIAGLNAEFASLDNIYYPKLIKAVSAKKFFKILCVEDRVARRILHNYNQKHSKKQADR